jgi:hypothetical protein
LIRWYDTSDGVRGLYMAYHTHYNGKWPDSLPEPARWTLAATSARATAEAMAGVDPIWCDPHMVNLLAAGADTYPPEPLVEHHLLAPDGIIIFAKPLPVVWLEPRTGTRTNQRISAISWCLAETADGRAAAGITAWTRWHGLARFQQPKLAIYYPGLRTLSYANGLFGIEPPDQGGPAGPHRILQAFTALCRAPLVGQESVPGSRAARAESASVGVPDRQIRRVYLRRPEYGQHELDAARAARAGHPPRGHWVRGHWKDQWHSSVGEHRTIWISGYPRGDFTRGMVPGSKVLVAVEPPLTAASE